MVRRQASAARLAASRWDDHAVSVEEQLAALYAADAASAAARNKKSVEDIILSLIVVFTGAIGIFIFKVWLWFISTDFGRIITIIVILLSAAVAATTDVLDKNYYKM